MTAPPAAPPLVELRGIVKAFPGAVANAGIDLTIRAGEVLAILGENGAGKSTLVSILAGLYRPDAGTIAFDGAPASLRSPRDAAALGVGMVHQHFRLIERFTVIENVLLGWRGAPFSLDLAAAARELERLANAHGLPVDPAARVWQLSVGERQRVEILKTLYRGARVLVLDEPTAVLTPQEIEPLLGAVRRLAREGRAAVFISHKLDEVLAVADRIAVLRAGRVVAEMRPAATTARELARLMVGHEVEVEAAAPMAPGPVALAVDGCRAVGDGGRVAVHDVSLEVRRHEILGIAGVAGSGQRELLEVIAGLRAPLAGRVRLDGADLAGAGARERWGGGIAYVPEDRLGEGLVPDFTVAENAVLRAYRTPPVARGPLVSWPAAGAMARAIAAAFQVRGAGERARVRHLSGGNQQRLLLGRESFGRPRVLLAMYPTRGLDVDAAAALHRALFALRAQGSAIVLASESLDELLAVSDRVAVLHRGRVAGIRPAATATREEIGLLMGGAAA